MKMLGRFRVGFCNNPVCCPQPVGNRRRKRAEQRQVQALALHETSSDARRQAFIDDHGLLAASAAFGAETDCHHGCNGDCETAGGERCNFTCHQDLRAQQPSQPWTPCASLSACSEMT